MGKPLSSLTHWLSIRSGIIFTIIVIVSCSQKQEGLYYQTDNSILYTDSVELKSTHQLKFRIPDNSALSFIRTFNFSDDDFYYYDSNANSVFVFSAEKEVMTDTFSLDLKGPNGIIPSTSNLACLISTDSLYMFDRTMKVFKLFFEDSCIATFDYNDFAVKDAKCLNISPISQPTLVERFFVNDDKIYFGIHQYLSYLLEEDSQIKNNNFVIYDTRTGSIRTEIPVPEIYQSGFWGKQTATFTNLYLTHNEDQNSFVFGFAADPYVYHRDSLGVYNKHYISSQFFKHIYPVSKKRSASKIESWKHSTISPSFSKLIYDKYRKVYYRFVWLGASEEDYLNGIKQASTSIIIFDSSFRKIGEQVINGENDHNKYVVNKAWISKGGMCLLRNDLYQINPDHFVFDVFSLEKKK